MKLPAIKAQTNDHIPAEELEANTLSEVNGVLEAFKQRAKNESVRLQDATDSEYWFAVCFQTREMKEEFLQKAGLIQYGDKYLDGLKVAKTMGVKLDSPVPPNRKITKFKMGGKIPIIP